MNVNSHGVSETNPLGPAGHPDFETDEMTDWAEPGLYITRLRLLSDPGYPFWDVSYCYGRLHGKDVRVALPFSELPKKNRNQAIVKWAKADGLYAKGTGIFDNISTLN